MSVNKGLIGLRAWGGLFVLAILASPGAAQTSSSEPPPDRGQDIVSMGQPGTFRYFTAGEVGLAPISDREFVGRFSLGVERTLLNPLVNLFAVSGEYFMGISGQAEGEVGLRLGLDSPILRLGGGWQYDFKRERGRGYVSFKHPLRRGGVFWPGGYFRVLWAPGNDQSLTVGATVPLAQPFAGRTRPREVKADVALPVSSVPPEIPLPSADAMAALEDAAVEAGRIRKFYVPYVDRNDGSREGAVRAFEADMATLAADLMTVAAEVPADLRGRQGYTPPEFAVRRFHAAMEAALGAACGECGVAPEVLAEAARSALLDEFVFPWNRMLARKKEGAVLDELTARARVAFARKVVLGTGTSYDRVEGTERAFARLVEIVRDNVEASIREWGDDRMAWIPIQYGLLPEDHDTQWEMDALVSRALNKPFMEGNEVWYVVSEQFQYELLRMINATRLYHVLWIHDIRGYDDSGEPDAVSFKIVMEGYLNALAERLEAFDREGRLPVYMIFIDQWFYEANKGRLWLDLLENPLTHEMELPEGFEDWEEQIAGAQDRLRRAIAASPLLQAEIREYGEDWLRNRVKVQVNVTNPADQTFGARELLPWIGFPDALMRDHRKISFYDVNADDPWQGMALYTGMGVGEHYTGATWDDRAIRVRGPALLYLRYEARDLLLQQGFRSEQIPFPLRQFDGELRTDLAAAGPTGPDSGRGIQLHNHIGYGPKDATVLKATLYNLMPSGAVSKSPDSLWNLPLWSSLLVGHALRGGRVAVVAPTDDTAPARSGISLSRAQEVLARMIVIPDLLAEPMAESRGLLKVGLYDPRVGVGDIPGKVRQVVDTYQAEDWLSELHGVGPDELATFIAVADSLEGAGFRERYIEGQPLDRPKLHMKAHLFANREGWDQLVTRPEFGDFMAEYVRQRAIQVAERGEDRDLTAMSEALRPATDRLFQAWARASGPDVSERAAWYLVVGSHNQNYRSMALDGEVLMTVSGPRALAGLADFYLILGLSTWLDTPEELEEYLPAAGNFFRRLSRWAQIVS
jgi:hypothetical protein